MKEDVLITSLTRTSKNAPWRVNIRTEYASTFFFTGEGGNVAASPRFNIFLMDIEKLVKRFPVEIDFLHLNNHREMTVTKVNDQIIYIDCGFEAKRIVSKGIYRYQPEVLGNPIVIPEANIAKEPLFTDTEDNDLVTFAEVDEIVSTSTLDYIAIAKVKSVYDGDTVEVEIAKTPNAVLRLKKGETIKVRFNGIDAPECKDSEQNDYKDSKNADFAKAYGASLKDVYSVAEESKKHLKKLLGFTDKNTPLIAINFDRKKDGDGPEKDKYGRYIADVYASKEEKNADIFMENISAGKSYIHANKSQLITKSKKYKQFPLAIYSLQFNYSGTTMLNSMAWGAELGISPIEIVGGQNIVQDKDDPEDDIDYESGIPYEKEIIQNEINFEYDDSAKPNAHDFFEPYDDRFKEFLGNVKTPDDLINHSKVRIGDVTLVIPPISINLEKSSSISKVKTLRTKSSVMVNSGQTLNTLTMDLYFHDLDSINGRPIPTKKDSKHHFVVDGLRPLLAQFSKAPFLPIDNYYINEVLGIQDVALMDIECRSVPNFPESITATLTLVEFNPESYLMNEDSLGDSLNYPMLRWFYNQSLSEAERPSKYRTFEKVEGLLTNDIRFTLAAEEDLEERKDALEWLKTAESPEKVKTDLKNKNIDYAAKKDDEVYIRKINKQLKAYNKLKKAGRIKKHSVIKYFSVGKYNNGKDITNGIDKAIMETYGKKQEEADNALLEGSEFFLDIYPDHYSSNVKKPVVNIKNIFLPYEGEVYFKERFNLSNFNQWNNGIDGEPPVDYSKAPYKGQEKLGLIRIQKFKDKNNQNIMDKTFKKYYDSKQKTYFIPASETAVKILKELETGTKDMEKAASDYEKVFNEYLAIIDASELGVRMRPYELTGFCVPISVNARFSNEFSMTHVLEGESPSLQYLGGGDPYLDIVFEMDQQSVTEFNNLLRISDKYAKQYRLGITNGFIGVQNQLAQLFGMTHLMFESVQVSTVPGFPDRFQVVVQAVGFDRTQRQREELRAIPGNTKHMNAEMLANNKNAFANDRLLESRMHTLEVYPDLELPTYEQLNAAIKIMDCKCEEYLNPSGGTYVDPDFYFSTGKTFRQMIEETYGGNHQMNLFDPTGIAGYSSSLDNEYSLKTTDEDLKKLKEIEKTDGVQPLDWTFSWGEKDSDSKKEQDDSAGTSLADKVGQAEFKNKEVEEFLKEMEEDGKTPKWEKFPSKKEWDRLFSNVNGTYKYEDYAKKPNGDETRIYNALSSAVDRNFKRHYVEPDLIKKLTGDLKKAPKSMKWISYAPADEMFAVSCGTRPQINKMRMDAATKYDRNKKKGDKTSGGKKFDDKIKSFKKPNVKKLDSKLTISDFLKTDGKITKERFMTIFKAFLDKASSWEQYKNKKPLVSAVGKVGIGQVDITSEYATVDEVKRLMYCWKYNLDQAISNMGSYYGGFEAPVKDDWSNLEMKLRPWDAMVAQFENPSKKVKSSKDIEKSDLASGTMSRFNYYAFKPFNTFSGFNGDVYKKFAGLSKKEKLAFGEGEKKKYIENLLALEYYNLKNLKSNGLTVDSKYSDIKPVSKKFLESKSEQEVYEIYQRHLNKLTKLDDKNWIAGEKDKNGYKYSGAVLRKAGELSSKVNEANDSIENSEADNHTRLTNDVDPHVLYQEMFYDMRTYDQRGRMIRAFPGFQMFIIHEGEWFGKYKFWDNMYGFNAIESIDVYKSRKIAADTAVISMTNVYSNLTTRRIDVDYSDRELKFWDNLVFDKIPKELIQKKENEFHKNMFLEPGARIHLRMGYNSNVASLPVVFNGVIAEMDTNEVITIVAQGDGVELGNIVSGDPDDTNDGLFNVTEPRDLICGLMSSKGSWLKDFLNNVSGGSLFEKNPLGIEHFGMPFDVKDTTSSKPMSGGNLIWYNDEYGEVAQNIYSTNGTPTYSQWVHPNGDRNNILSGTTWKNLWENKTKMFNPGDEDNVVMKLYNMTVWDVIQTAAYTSPDYIAAVTPFEFRSTLFFGKPYWRCSFGYDSRYSYDESAKSWDRTLIKENKRPYMQHKMYFSQYDIIQNNIKASDDNLFTNIIVQYDGNQTPVQYADVDIRYDKQKTRVVEANIVAKFGDFYTSEVVATHYGLSALKDNLKDMYRGNILVMGDPSVKPHDTLGIFDSVNDMNGTSLVKAVTHHFSRDTGFVTSIEPDLYVVNDDTVMTDIGQWYSSFLASTAASIVPTFLMRKSTRFVSKWLRKTGQMSEGIGKWLTSKSMVLTFKGLNDDTKEMRDAIELLDKMVADSKKGLDIKETQKAFAKKLDDISKKIVRPPGTKRISGKGLKLGSKKIFLMNTSKIVKSIANGGKITTASKNIIATTRALTSTTAIGIVVNIATFIASTTLFEKYKRFKESLQCVVAIPLSYKGQELTAGINGHAGMIVGDAPGRYDRMFAQTFSNDLGDDTGQSGFFSFMTKLVNFFEDSNVDKVEQSVEANKEAATELFYANAGSYIDPEKSKKLNELSKKLTK